jgi:hypothetical protein
MRSDGQPCRLHAWSCPVIMKTAPDRVAWTCAHCGSLAVTGVGERPQPSARPQTPQAGDAAAEVA